MRSKEIPTTRTELRERLRELSDRWRIALERTVESPGSIVAFGTRDGAPVVVKVLTRAHDEWDSGAVTASFAGRGMVRALDYLPGAALLEEVRPGAPLVTLSDSGRDEEANGVFATLMEEMRGVGADVAGHPLAEDWAWSFGRYLEGNDRSIPIKMVEDARDRYETLCRSQGPVRLLHGDLQHYNVLLDAERGWLAIDPKGVVAETEFELGAILRNPSGIPELHSLRGLEARSKQLAGALGLDVDRVVGWALAQAVLSAVWMVEDGEELSSDTVPLRVARAFRELIG